MRKTTKICEKISVIFFEQALSELIVEKAKERAGKSQLNAESIKISLKVNGTLGNGEIEVKVTSDSSIELGDTLPVENDVSSIPVSEKKQQQGDFQEKKIIKEVGTIPDTGTIKFLSGNTNRGADFESVKREVNNWIEASGHPNVDSKRCVY